MVPHDRGHAFFARARQRVDLAQGLLRPNLGHLGILWDVSGVAEQRVFHPASALRHFRLGARDHLCRFRILRVLSLAIGGTLRVVLLASANGEQLVDASGPARARGTPEDGAHFVAHLQSVKSGECRRITYEPDRHDRFVLTKFESVVGDGEQFPNIHARFVIRGACDESKEDEEKEEYGSSHHFSSAVAPEWIGAADADSSSPSRLTLFMSTLVNKPPARSALRLEFPSSDSRCIVPPMPALRPFEEQAIRLLATNVVAPELLEALDRLPEATRYEYTGCGYFLTLSHPQLPEGRQTLSTPSVVGHADDIQCGFVVFLGEHELTLECHTWGEIDVPADFRERDVRVSVSDDAVIIDLR